MTILFSSANRQIMMARGIHALMPAAFAITIYKGTQPSASDIETGWVNYNSASANYLAHYLGASFTRPQDGIMLQLGLPAAVVPTGSGAGSWCILWITDVSLAAVAGATIPSTAFIVAKVSDAVGDGIIRFTDINFVSGTSKVIADGSIAAYN